MKKAIVTGHSRGLGAALAVQLEQDDWEVLGISRSAGERVDLGDPSALLAWLEGDALPRFLADASEILLINNAGLLGSAEVAGRADPAATVAAVNVNVTALILLTDAVLRERPVGVPTRIAHISSGAGRRPVPGWSVYCATKAAVDHHAATVAAENLDGVRIAAIAPGVVDTDMQAAIRGSEGFPGQADFVELKESGSLASPVDAARGVLRLIDAPSYGSEIQLRV